MGKFRFQACIAGVLRKLEVSDVSGSGYHIYVNGYYGGMLAKMDNRLLYIGSSLEEDDLVTIIAWMRRYEHHILEFDHIGSSGRHQIDIYDFDRYYEVDFDGLYGGSLFRAKNGVWQQFEGLPIPTDVINAVGYTIQQYLAHKVLIS